MIELRRELTDSKLANEALKEQVRGFKEQLATFASTATPTTALATTMENAVGDQSCSLTDGLSELQHTIESEQVKRKRAENELTRQHQDAKAQQALIERMRATIDQSTSHVSNEASELQAIKEDLEVKQHQLLEINDSLQRELTERMELETQLSVKERRVTELEERASLVSGLEERISQLVKVEQECESLRLKIHEIDQLEAYVTAQLQIISNDMFAPDSTDPDIVTSSTSTTIADNIDKSTYSVCLRLRQGIEKLTSMLHRLGSELAQRDKREAEHIQQTAEHEMAINQLTETYRSQQQEMENQFALERSTFEKSIQLRTKEVDDLENQLKDVGMQMATLQSRLNDTNREFLIKEEEATKFSNICVDLERQLSEQKARCDEMETKTQELTLKHAQLLSERDALSDLLEKSLTCVEHLRPDGMTKNDEQVRQQSHRDSDNLTKLVCIKQSVKSVRESIDQIRDEFTSYQTTNLAQTFSEMNHFVRLVQSSWNQHMSTIHKSDEVGNENQRLQSEVSKSIYRQRSQIWYRHRAERRVEQ